ncbi:hypothetical protein [Jeongeupia chitinilytica]|uniref:Uncharacterized protein n=1 Tax=Jeongeupia chitinilytica TaxID=1041641 RepID=A0ABQ3GX83_9NEIS|nr:hypothetical protein [Jeongeupia chitinilytica]GHD59508.1 hypothetical protein GCM10007350_11090 [Jeongeupia chitinilytica]
MRVSIYALFTTFVTTPAIAIAFSINQSSTYNNQSEQYTDSTRAPLHENFTVLAIKSSNIQTTYKTEKFITETVSGVRWNDDPLNMAPNHPISWGLHFETGCLNHKKVGTQWDLSYRTHCGDIQFLHSMASNENEIAKDTITAMKMWFEFTYKVSSGEIPAFTPFSKVGKYLSLSSSEQFNAFFTKPYPDWTPAGLFKKECYRKGGNLLKPLGSRTTLVCKKQIYSSTETQNRALGSALHMIEDSFSSSHVMRENNKEYGISHTNNAGRIVKFGNYNLQDGFRHAEADKNYDSEAEGRNNNMIQIAGQFIALALSERQDKVNRWSDAEVLFNENFETTDENAKPDSIGYEHKQIIHH